MNRSSIIKLGSSDEKGFTIMELMIATAILAVLLLMSSVVMIGIANLFEKGINITNLQNVNRNIVSEITSDIQFSGEKVDSGSYSYPTGAGTSETVYAICFGNVRYSYVINFPPSNWSHTIWKDEMSSPGSCIPLNIGMPIPNCSVDVNCIPSSTSVTGGDLAGPNMHIAYLKVQSIGNSQVYSIAIGMMLGQSYLFESSSVPPGTNYICNTNVGQQFCATSSLSAVATERLLN